MFFIIPVSSFVARASLAIGTLTLTIRLEGYSTGGAHCVSSTFCLNICYKIQAHEPELCSTMVVAKRGWQVDTFHLLILWRVALYARPMNMHIIGPVRPVGPRSGLHIIFCCCFLFIFLLAICRPSDGTVASGVVGVGVVVVVVIVVVVSNRSQMRTSKCTYLIFGMSIGLDPG